MAIPTAAANVPTSRNAYPVGVASIAMSPPEVGVPSWRTSPRHSRAGGAPPQRDRATRRPAYTNGAFATANSTLTGATTVQAQRHQERTPQRALHRQHHQHERPDQPGPAQPRSPGAAGWGRAYRRRRRLRNAASPATSSGSASATSRRSSKRSNTWKYRVSLIPSCPCTCAPTRPCR